MQLFNSVSCVIKLNDHEISYDEMIGYLWKHHYAWGDHLLTESIEKAGKEKATPPEYAFSSPKLFGNDVLRFIFYGSLSAKVETVYDVFSGIIKNDCAERKIAELITGKSYEEITNQELLNVSKCIAAYEGFKED